MTTPPPERFPDWETLYRQQPGESLPWYYADLDPDLEAAFSSPTYQLPLQIRQVLRSPLRM